MNAAPSFFTFLPTLASIHPTGLILEQHRLSSFC
jgi:hypothetical protein